MRTGSVPPGRPITTTSGYELPCVAAVRAPARSPQPFGLPFTIPTPPDDYINIFPGFRLSFREAEDILQLYKSSYSPLFPFVPVPQTTSAYDLFEAKPFLFRTIMTVTAPQNAATQKKADVWFREHVAEHMVVKQEKSVELLQAILVCIAW